MPPNMPNMPYSGLDCGCYHPWQRPPALSRWRYYHAWPPQFGTFKQAQRVKEEQGAQLAFDVERSGEVRGCGRLEKKLCATSSPMPLTLGFPPSVRPRTHSPPRPRYACIREGH
jgi:hypothetical protein